MLCVWYICVCEDTSVYGPVDVGTEDNFALYASGSISLYLRQGPSLIGLELT